MTNFYKITDQKECKVVDIIMSAFIFKANFLINYHFNHPLFVLGFFFMVGLHPYLFYRCTSFPDLKKRSLY